MKSCSVHKGLLLLMVIVGTVAMIIVVRWGHRNIKLERRAFHFCYEVRSTRPGLIAAILWIKKKQQRIVTIIAIHWNDYGEYFNLDKFPQKSHLIWARIRDYEPRWLNRFIFTLHHVHVMGSDTDSEQCNSHYLGSGFFNLRGGFQFIPWA